MSKRPHFRMVRPRMVRLSLWALMALGLMLLLGSIVPTRWVYSQPSDCTYSIFVSSVNHFHAELIVPITTPVFDWRAHLNVAQMGERWASYRYLSFGWGDRNFFMNGSLDPISIADALFLPGPTVLHVWGHINNPMTLAPTFAVKQLWLNQTEYLKLMQFIEASFQRNPWGNTDYLRPGLYPESGFYAATGTYSIFKTCNNWTADALRYANVNTPLWSGLAPAVMEQLRSNCGVGQG